MQAATEWDVARFEAMVEAMPRYLDGGEPYRKALVETPDGRREMSTLSIGVLLDLADTLGGPAQPGPGGGGAWQPSSGDASPRDDDRVEVALRALDDVRSAHAEAYGRMLLRELKGSLDAWRWFLSECESGERRCAEDYSSEVLKRLRAERLLEEARQRGLDAEEAAARTARLDERLDALFERDEGRGYCGPKGERERYPPRRYWWLYGRPRAAAT